LETVIDALLIFPHQLFASNAALARGKTAYLVEDALYFVQYPFHKQKLILHRASMRAHSAFLLGSGAKVIYIEAAEAPTMEAVMRIVAKISHDVHYIDPVDDWLQRRLTRAAAAQDCTLFQHDTDMFLNDAGMLRKHLEKPRPSMANFYAAERKRLGILVTNGKPDGGKWSLDAENRKRLPAKIDVPEISMPAANDHVGEAREYVDAHFPGNPGRTYRVT